MKDLFDKLAELKIEYLELPSPILLDQAAYLVQEAIFRHEAVFRTSRWLRIAAGTRIRDLERWNPELRAYVCESHTLEPGDAIFGIPVEVKPDEEVQ